VKQLDLDLG